MPVAPRRLAWMVVLPLLLAAGPPSPRPHVPDSARPRSDAAADTLRGIVAVVGSSRAPRVVLVTDDGVEHAIGGPAVAALRRVADLEVVVSGTTERRSFVATRFLVRAADGRPAEDGILARQGAGWVLERIGAAPLPIAELPEALRAAEKRRVWIVRGDRGEIVGYGIIE